jgi:hypothetical protein
MIYYLAFLGAYVNILARSSDEKNYQDSHIQMKDEILELSERIHKIIACKMHHFHIPIGVTINPLAEWIIPMK